MDVLMAFELNGRDALPSVTRGRITYSEVVTDLTQSSSGSNTPSQGIKEFLLQNVTSEMNVTTLELRTLEQPFHPQGGTLQAEWSYFDEKTESFLPYAPSYTVRNLGPGKTLRVRRRTTSPEGAGPFEYLGQTQFPYTYVAVG